MNYQQRVHHAKSIMNREDSVVEALSSRNYNDDDRFRVKMVKWQTMLLERCSADIT